MAENAKRRLPSSFLSVPQGPDAENDDEASPWASEPQGATSALKSGGQRQNRRGQRAKVNKHGDMSAFDTFKLSPFVFGSTQGDPHGANKPTYNAENNPNEHHYLIHNVPITFPFAAYPSQIMVMQNMIAAMERGENALLESPTGTGKTLAILCASISWQQWQQASQLPPGLAAAPSDPAAPDAAGAPRAWHGRVYIATRTQKQVHQIVNEMRGKTSFRPLMSVLGSRSHYCVNPDVKDRTRSDECQDLVSEENCLYFKNSNRVVAATAKTGVPARKPVWDMEDLVQIGKREIGCPYFASREMHQSAQVVFCPYNYLINPSIRERCDIVLDDAVIVIDEAHNIEDVCRDAGSVDLREDALDALRIEMAALSAYHDLQQNAATTRGLAEALYNWLKLRHTRATTGDSFSSHCVFEGGAIAGELAKVGITADSARVVKNALEELRQTMRSTEDAPGVPRTWLAAVPNQAGVRDAMPAPRLSGNSDVLLNSLIMIFTWIFDHGHHRDYCLAIVKQRQPAGSAGQHVYESHGSTSSVQPAPPLVRGHIFTMSFWCLNPAIVFREVASLARSVILTSGTLSPLDSFASELGVSFPHSCSAGHVAQRSQMWVGTIARGPSGALLDGTYKSSVTLGYQDDLGALLEQVLGVCRAGVLCFLPSYAQLQRLKERWTATGLWKRLATQRDLFEEPRRANEFDSVLASYKNAVAAGRGALMLAIFRGKLSEGIDLPGDAARCVFAVGIPFPNYMDPAIKQKQRYNNELLHRATPGAARLSGSRWYEIQAYRALNQALGRCIRHASDWGAMVLLDHRMGVPKRIEALAQWMRDQVNVHQDANFAVQSLADFYQRQTSQDATAETVIGGPARDEADPSRVIVIGGPIERPTPAAPEFSMASQAAAPPRGVHAPAGCTQATCGAAAVNGCAQATAALLPAFCADAPGADAPGADALGADAPDADAPDADALGAEWGILSDKDCEEALMSSQTQLESQSASCSDGRQRDSGLAMGPRGELGSASDSRPQHLAVSQSSAPPVPMVAPPPVATLARPTMPVVARPTLPVLARPNMSMMASQPMPMMPQTMPMMAPQTMPMMAPQTMPMMASHPVPMMASQPVPMMAPQYVPRPMAAQHPPLSAPLPGPTTMLHLRCANQHDLVRLPGGRLLLVKSTQRLLATVSQFAVPPLVVRVGQMLVVLQGTSADPNVLVGFPGWTLVLASQAVPGAQPAEVVRLLACKACANAPRPDGVPHPAIAAQLLQPGMANVSDPRNDLIRAICGELRSVEVLASDPAAHAGY